MRFTQIFHVAGHDTVVAKVARPTWHTRRLGALVLVLSAVLGLGIGACSSRSEQELQDEFDAFVAKRNQCVATSDCALVYAGCPLGCDVAVRKEQVNAVKDKAEELIDEYESSDQSCDYECISVEAQCQEGRCVAAQMPPSGS